MATTDAGGGCRLDRAKSVDDLLREDPSFLRPYRLRVRCELEERLEEAGVVEGTRLASGAFDRHMASIKEKRKAASKNVLPAADKASVVIVVIKAFSFFISQKSSGSTGKSVRMRLKI